MTRLFESPLRVFAVWLVLCFVTFCVLHSVATRPIPVRVEDHRQSFMGDEQAVVAAMQVAKQRKVNLWWIEDKQPYLVLDPNRSYELSEAFLASRGVGEIRTDTGAPVIGLMQRVSRTR
jgi:hypothetical protein